MKAVLQHIMRRRRQYARGPFFTWLADDAIDPRARLGFLPAMAHWVLSFGDLNRYVLRYDDPRTDLERAINAHADEDATHWVWFLDDLRALDLDTSQSRVHWLLDCWSPETAAARTLTYTLVGLVAGTTPAERLAVIEVIEEAGNAVFLALAPVVARLERERGVRLPFCGKDHLDRETGHTLHLDHGELAAVELDPEARARAIARVDTAFTAFERFLGALHDYARRRAAPSLHRDPAPARPAACDLAV